MVTSRKYAAPEDDAIFTTERDRSPNPADDREINLRQMNEQGIKSLRESDPFMYYSIPGVRKAALCNKEVDYSDVTKLSQDRPRSPRPTLSLEQAEDKDVNKVSRTSRVSFESHPSVILEDVMDELEQELGDLSFDVFDFMSMLHSRSGDTKTKQ